jgi:23S rRNA maturation-related 3'-5' exoribonuclease YhaM
MSRFADQIMKTIDAGMVSHVDIPTLSHPLSHKSLPSQDKKLTTPQDDVTTKPYRIQDMLKQIERLIAKYTRNSDGDGA